MKRFITYILLLSVLLLSGCLSNRYYKRSFIDRYETIAGTSLTNDGIAYISTLTETKYLTFRYSVDKILNENNNSAQYDELCSKHNDMHFNQNVLRGELYATIAYDFATVDIVSNSDWDEQHPSGTSLNDIAMMTYVSYFPFVKANYSGSAAPTLYVRPVAQLSADDLKMLGCSGNELCSFSFDSLPTMSQTHTITVTFITDEGEKFAASTTLNFAE